MPIWLVGGEKIPIIQGPGMPSSFPILFFFLDCLEDGKCRLDICRKIYTTGFSGKQFYTLKVQKFRLFSLKKNSANALTSVILVAFLLEFN